jgi:hypothetical protein
VGQKREREKNSVNSGTLMESACTLIRPITVKIKQFDINLMGCGTAQDFLVFNSVT